MDERPWIVPPQPDDGTTAAERATLQIQGFTAEQIEALCRLRSVYPVIEFVDPEETHRLLFLQWLRRKWLQSRTPGKLDEPPLAT